MELEYMYSERGQRAMGLPRPLENNLFYLFLGCICPVPIRR